jgi:hypothetical protein
MTDSSQVAAGGSESSDHSHDSESSTHTSETYEPGRQRVSPEPTGELPGEPAPLDPRVAAFVAEQVEAKRQQWIATNTITSPFVQQHTPEPSPQHIQTWTDEATALAVKEIRP